MGDTSISWTSKTWNPIRGCQRTAPEGSKQSGCGDPSGGGCYAERQAARFCGPGAPYDGLIKLTANGPRWSGKTKLVREHLLDPIRWRKPHKIFTDSMSDLFYKGFSDAEIDMVVAVMMICCLATNRAGHIFQTLTKRPDRMRAYFADPKTCERVARAAAELESNPAWFDRIMAAGLRHPDLWWGTSVENQAAAEERIPQLLAADVAVRFLSIEPMLGPIDLDMPRCDDEHHGPAEWSVDEETATPWCNECDSERSFGHWLHLDGGIDWAIVGCESGPRARECKTEWIRVVRDQLAAAGVAFFLKQAAGTDLGRCGDADNPNGDRPCKQPITAYVYGQGHAGYSCGCTIEGPEDGVAPALGAGEGSDLKGRGFGGKVIELPYLDGVQHAAFPEIER